jgi:glycosyltransferase involved in cell wall biosynthesis
MSRTSRSTTSPSSPTSAAPGPASTAPRGGPRPSTPLRILIVSDDPDDPTVGAAKAPRKLQAALRALGHDCDLIFSENLGERPRNERLRFAASPWLAWRAVRRAWRERGPYDVLDVVAAEAAVLARRRAAFPGAALVARSHGLDHFFYRGLVDDHRARLLRKPWWRRAWYPLVRLRPAAAALRRADAAILLNRRERAFILDRGWLPPDRLAVVAHGIEPERWAAAPPPGARRGAGFLFSGAWYTGKGNRTLAQAHARLARRGQAMPLTLLGGGVGLPLAAIEAHVRSGFAPESQPWLTVLPRLRDEDAVFALYRSHDALVCPSSAEGFGMVVFEALSQRLPVLCSRSVGAAEWLRDGESVALVPPRDAPALADAMLRLWRCPDLRLRLAESGFRHVGAFSWRRAAEETLACYRHALDSRDKRSKLKATG